MAADPLPADLQVLQHAVRAGRRFGYLLFYGHRLPRDGSVGPTCMSQHYAAGFREGGVFYPTAEHFMMAEKARLFGDEEHLAAILVAGAPMAAKQLGRAVRGFDQATWNDRAREIVVRGNRGKFAQNPDLERFLLGTGDRVLVEASPSDRIWGIGLGASQADAADPLRWRGRNQLGFALMEVRAALGGPAVARRER